jgi:hypothetical protein
MARLFPEPLPRTRDHTGPALPLAGGLVGKDEAIDTSHLLTSAAARPGKT